MANYFCVPFGIIVLSFLRNALLLRGENKIIYIGA